MVEQGPAARTRASARPALRVTLAVAPVLLLLMLFFVMPLADLFGIAFTEHVTGGSPAEAGTTLANFRNFLGDWFYLGMVLNSVLLGFATVVTTLLIGYPVAFYLTRASGWERTLISVACLLPIFINVIVGILGWYILFLPFGVLQQILSALGLVDGPIRILRSFGALIAVLTYEHLPFAILILASTLQNVPADKINAARILGAPTHRIITTVVLPLTAPGIVACAILVFSLSVSSYLVPILISGPRTQVLPIAIFSYASELLNWPMASAMALVLLLVVGAITYTISAVAGRITRRGQWEMV
jgi:putative spermidine/putrescine transport system permease protein